MQNTPDVNMVFPLQIEGDVGIAFQHQASQTGQTQIVGITRRAALGPLAHAPKGDLQGIDKTLCDPLSRRCDIVVDRLLDVAPR